MEILLIASPLILCMYLLWVYSKYGMTSSFSETYTKLSENEKPLFSLTFFLYLIPIVIISNSVWFSLSGLFLMLVSSNPNYWNKGGMQDNLHYIGAYGTVLSGFIGLISESIIIGVLSSIIYFTFAICVELNYHIFKKVNNETYWQEFVAAVSVPIILFFILSPK